MSGLRRLWFVRITAEFLLLSTVARAHMTVDEATLEQAALSWFRRPRIKASARPPDVEDFKGFYPRAAPGKPVTPACSVE